jgi:FHA domain
MSDQMSTKDQLRAWVSELAPEHRRDLLNILEEDESAVSSARIEMAADQLRRICRDRDLDWDALDEPERETLLDLLIREDVEATQAGPTPARSIRRAICSHCGRDLTPHDLYRIYFSSRRPSAGFALAKLMVIDADQATAQFPLLAEAEIYIGRLDPHRGIRPEVDLSAYDPSSRVSRKHARIVLRGNQFFIEDLGSANGTTINGQSRLKPQESYALTNGDLIRIGHTTLKFITSQP